MSNNELISKCINCDSKLQSFTKEWLLHCDNCGLDKSLLYDEKYNGQNPIGWTESASDFLEILREHNANSVLTELSQHLILKDKHVLDIGCAAGWFLGVAKQYHMIATGLEPEKNIAAKGIENGHDIKTVTFPDKSIADIKFDVISFNDVFEHIVEPADMLDQVYKQLKEDGYLVINLPTTNGFIYKLSSFLGRFGYSPPMERLWQKGYFSPHLYYYSNKNLSHLVEKHGFKLIVKDSLDVIRINGLWSRINHNKAMNPVISGVIYISILMTYPLIKYVLPSDIMFHIYKKD